MPNTGRPIVITVSGKPDVVLMDAEVFEEKMMALNLLNLLQEAEEDVREGRVSSAKDFLKELRG